MYVLAKDSIYFIDIKVFCSVVLHCMLLSCIVQYFTVLYAGSMNLSKLITIKIAGQKIL